MDEGSKKPLPRVPLKADAMRGGERSIMGKDRKSLRRDDPEKSPSRGDESLDDRLRALYRAVLDEPLPDDMLDLLNSPRAKLLH
jgi:hypothetical protein